MGAIRVINAPRPESANGAFVSAAPVGRMRWIVVGATFTIAAIAYLDRSNISIAAPILKKDLSLSDVQLGTIFSAFVLGYALAQPIAGRVADRFGAYPTIAVGIFLWSVLTAATASVPSTVTGAFGIILAVRFALGLGEAVIFPASNRLVSRWVPRRNRGLANGLIFSGVGIGAGIAPPLITSIMIAHDWRTAFWVTAAIGLVAMVGWLVVVRETPDRHPWVGEPERRYIAAGTDEVGAADHVGVARWSSIVGNRDVLLLTFSYFCFGYVAYIFFSWFFTYLSSVRGLDLKSSGIYATLPFLAMAVASPLGGWISDRLAPHFGERAARCWTAAGAMTAASAFVALATLVTDARLASLVLAAGSGSLYLAQSAYWTLSANIGRQSAGSVSGFMNMGSQLGGVLVGVLTPIIAHQYGWSASFLVTAGVCLAGAAAWLGISKDPHL